MYTVFIHSEIDGFLLFTVGPLLLSVKGIIDLAQMPPTILLPHPGGTGTPTLERIAYLPGAQPPFPPRAFNPTSISPGEDPSLPHSYTCVPLNFPATISVCLHTSLGVQPCTDLGCQRSVLPVQSLLSLPAITPGGVFSQTSLTIQQYDFFPLVLNTWSPTFWCLNYKFWFILCLNYKVVFSTLLILWCHVFILFLMSASGTL